MINIELVMFCYFCHQFYQISPLLDPGFSLGASLVWREAQMAYKKVEPFPILYASIYIILSYPFLSYPFISYPTLSYPIPFYPTLVNMFCQLGHEH